MLELTCLGHATLLVRSSRAAVLCDPILGDAVSGGGNVVHPQRTVHLERLPPLSAVLISHHHSDHFSLPDLARLPGIQEQRILTPDGSEVIDQLRRFGCSRVEPLHPGRPAEIEDISVIPTPSAVDFPEVGFLFRSQGAAALNLVDTQIHGVFDDLLRILGGPVQLVLAPFQAGGYMSLLPLRVGGPPDGLVEAILRWSEEYTEELVTDLARLRPQHVVPFADGLLYRDEGINAWHFPLPDEVFLDRMARRGIPGCVCTPGSTFVVSSAGIELRAQGSGLVTTASHQSGGRAFDPGVRLSDVPLSCADWNPALRDGATGQTWAALCASLRARLEANISQTAGTGLGLSRERVDRLSAWFLELCGRAGAMKYLSVEQGCDGFRVRLADQRPASREYGLRLHASDLLHLLDGRILLEHITLGGAFRYYSPRVVADLERIRGRVFGPLYTVIGMG